MFTYREMKEKLATFTDAQLDMRAIWSGEEIGGNEVHLTVIAEECRMTEDGMQPVSAYSSEEWEEIRAEAGGELKVWPVGMPLLMVD